MKMYFRNERNFISWLLDNKKNIIITNEYGKTKSKRLRIFVKWLDNYKKEYNVTFKHLEGYNGVINISCIVDS